jgi:hypothetical protein
MASSLVVPKFASETEEAEWWYESRHLVEQEFLTASAEGRLGRGTLKRRIEEAQQSPRVETTIQLDEQDAIKARAAAERRGMQFSSFVKMLVHNALEQDDTSPSR